MFIFLIVSYIFNLIWMIWVITMLLNLKKENHKILIAYDYLIKEINELKTRKDK